MRNRILRFLLLPMILSTTGCVVYEEREPYVERDELYFIEVDEPRGHDRDEDRHHERHEKKHHEREEREHHERGEHGDRD